VSAALQQLQVPDAAAMEQAITSYIAQGFTVQSRTETSVTLFKKKEFSVLWAVVGLLLCLLPLLVYLIVYATQRDQMVQIVMASPATPAIHWNEDFTQWYDHAGSRWRSTTSGLPQGVPISDDGAYFYNGSSWIPRPAGATKPPPAGANRMLPPTPEKPSAPSAHDDDGLEDAP
jgi:hypothetical protein